jgi:hypothetical protein
MLANSDATVCCCAVVNEALSGFDAVLNAVRGAAKQRSYERNPSEYLKQQGHEY